MTRSRLALFIAGIGAGLAALDRMARLPKLPTFGMRYGHAPRSLNGGQRSGAAHAKRMARRRRNIAKHPRCRG